MSDRITALAAFLRQHARTEKGELLRLLFEQFPEATGTEIQAALNLRRPVLTLAKVRPQTVDGPASKPGNGRATSSGTTKREAAE